MAGLDTSIYGNVTKPQTMSLSDMVSLARNAQEFKKEQELYEPTIEKSKSESKSASISAEKSGFELQKAYTDASFQEANALINDKRIKNANLNDPNSIKEAAIALENATDRMIQKGIPKHLAYSTAAPYYQLLKTRPDTLIQELENSTLAQAGSATQQTLQTPSYTTNATGQIVGIKAGPNQIISPNEANAPISAPAAGATNQLQSQFDPKRSLNPTRAEVAFTTTPVEIAQKDLTETLALAKGAEPRIATFQNIKKLAPESFTSTGGARKELAAGIAQALGIDVYTAEKTATDELAKNSAMLTLTGGNTDLARQIAEAANPNKKMTEGAIKQMADQLIGVERLNQAKANYLGNVKNPQEYQEKMNIFNKINDYRIFQETTADEVKKLKASMSPDEQRRMSEKIKLAKSLGLI